MGTIWLVTTILLVVSIFFTDNRIGLVNYFMWVLTMIILAVNKNSQGLNKGILFYILLLIATLFIEVMFFKIDAIEERKYSKFFWICLSITLGVFIFYVFTSPRGERSLLELLIFGVIAVFIFISVLYELCFIYIFVPICMLCAKREKLIDANIEGVYTRGRKNSLCFALEIKNYTSKDFFCNKKTEEKFKKRKKDVITIEAIRIPLFNRIVIPNI